MINNDNTLGVNSTPAITYPQLQVGIVQQGIIITILYSEFHSEVTILNADTCDKIVALWIQQKKQQAGMVDLARRIQKEKLA